MAKTKTIENLFIKIDIYSSLIPITLFIIYWKATKRQVGLLLLFIYTILFLATDSVLLENTSPVFYQMYTILEFCLFTGFIYTQIHSAKMKRVMIGSGFFFAVFGFVFPLLWHGNMMIDSIPIGVETIIILVFAFYYLYERMNDTTTLFIYSTYPFWIVIGIVLYLSGSFFTYIFAGSLSIAERNKYWTITNIFSILRTVFFCIGIVINSKSSKKNPSELDFSSLN